MRGDFPDDTFTQIDVERELNNAGLQWHDKGRYLLAQCPTHEDKHPSVQIYKDDWFVNCHASCGRYHITKAFPSLRDNQKQEHQSYQPRQSFSRANAGSKKVSERVYKQFDLMEDWKKMPLIPRDHNFKNIPLEILDNLGWRWVPDRNQYFIPYFSRSKTSIPFAQYRNLSGEPRFIFLKDAKPTMYGTFNLYPNEPIFLVEGTSDAAVLDFCAIPWIAAPSAASGELVRSMCHFAAENGIRIVYAGDNDEAGDKLRQVVDETIAYRVKQPPKKYKDWGDFFVAEGYEAVGDYCMEELSPKILDDDVPESIAEVFPGAESVDVPDIDFTKNETDPESVRSNLGSASTLF